MIIIGITTLFCIPTHHKNIYLKASSINPHNFIYPLLTATLYNDLTIINQSFIAIIRNSILFLIYNTYIKTIACSHHHQLKTTPSSYPSISTSSTTSKKIYSASTPPSSSTKTGNNKCMLLCPHSISHSPKWNKTHSTISTTPKSTSISSSK